MGELQKRVTAILEDGALLAAFEDQKERDIAGGLERLDDVGLIQLIADKTAAIQDAQQFISAAGRVLLDRQVAGKVAGQY